jgi:hypothetical protein
MSVEMFRIIVALILTPVVALCVALIAACIDLIIETYGEDILGMSFLLGFLALIFSIIYKLL